jgi:type II secretory pathway predicted ATPase ExeA
MAMEAQPLWRRLNLRGNPFAPAPNSRHLAANERLDGEVALARALQKRHSLIALSSEDERGRLSLVQAAFSRADLDATTVIIPAWQVGDAGVLTAILRRMDPDAVSSPPERLGLGFSSALGRGPKSHVFVILDGADAIDGEVVADTLRLWAVINAKRPRLSLVLVGGPPLLDKLRTLLAHMVHAPSPVLVTVGASSRREVEAYLAARLIVSGYRGEFPLTVDALEALAALSHGELQEIDRCCAALFAATMPVAIPLDGRVVAQALADGGVVPTPSAFTASAITQPDMSALPINPPGGTEQRASPPVETPFRQSEGVLKPTLKEKGADLGSEIPDETRSAPSLDGNGPASPRAIPPTEDAAPVEAEPSVAPHTLPGSEIATSFRPATEGLSDGAPAAPLMPPKRDGVAARRSGKRALALVAVIVLVASAGMAVWLVNTHAGMGDRRQAMLGAPHPQPVAPTAPSALAPRPKEHDAASGPSAPTPSGPAPSVSEAPTPPGLLKPADMTPPEKTTEQITPPGADGEGERATDPVADVPTVAAGLTRQPSATVTIDPSQAADLVARGKTLLANADIVSAQLLFRFAAERGSGAAARALAATVDPVVLAETPIAGSRPDPAMAAEWYQRAMGLGDADAHRAYDRLIRALRERAASGNGEAEALLRHLK